VRHPQIVRYIDVISTGSSVSVVTERIVPLEEVLRPDMTAEDLILGLSNILVRLASHHKEIEMLTGFFFFLFLLLLCCLIADRS